MRSTGVENITEVIPPPPPPHHRTLFLSFRPSLAGNTVGRGTGQVKCTITVNGAIKNEYLEPTLQS
jgi:hypothetical protein